MSRPFKMKGSPMQRNFGIGSPLARVTDLVKKDDEWSFKGSQEASKDYNEMKKRGIQSSDDIAQGDLVKRYGGTWSKTTETTTDKNTGNTIPVGSWVNQDGQTPANAEQAYLGELSS